jgi:hypothetical protein
MPRIDIALVYTDGRKEVVTVGRPADLIAFADTFEKVAPSEPHVIREAAWLAHHALHVDRPLDEWVQELDDITTDDAAVAAIRGELNQHDPPGAAEQAATVTPIAPAVDDPPATSREIESHA